MHPDTAESLINLAGCCRQVRGFAKGRIPVSCGRDPRPVRRFRRAFGMRKLSLCLEKPPRPRRLRWCQDVSHQGIGNCLRIRGEIIPSTVGSSRDSPDCSTGRENTTRSGLTPLRRRNLPPNDRDRHQGRQPGRSDRRFQSRGDLPPACDRCLRYSQGLRVRGPILPRGRGLARQRLGADHRRTEELRRDRIAAEEMVRLTSAQREELTKAIAAYQEGKKQSKAGRSGKAIRLYEESLKTLRSLKVNSAWIGPVLTSMATEQGKLGGPAAAAPYFAAAAEADRERYGDADERYGRRLYLAGPSVCRPWPRRRSSHQGSVSPGGARAIDLR